VRARIAVLPFSGPAELAPGLAWLTAAAIARARRLAVTDAAEAEALARDPASARSRAAATGLRAVLEGEVTGSTEALSVSALLHDPRTGDHLLALSETADAAGAWALPDRLAAAIARRANEPEAPPGAAPTRDPGCFRALLAALGARDPGVLAGALEDAIAADPGCALAHALLAHAFSLRAETDPGALRDTEALATRALSLDPSDARTLALAAAALARAGSQEARHVAALAAAAGEGDGEAKALLRSAGLMPG
jgi:TolB-like protein